MLYSASYQVESALDRLMPPTKWQSRAEALAQRQQGVRCVDVCVDRLIRSDFDNIIGMRAHIETHIGLRAQIDISDLDRDKGLAKRRLSIYFQLVKILEL